MSRHRSEDDPRLARALAAFRRAKIASGPVAPAAPTTAKVLTPVEVERLKIAELACTMLCREWFGGVLSVEANRILPGILLRIYKAQLRGVRISKREACERLRIDPTTTGARYIAMAEEHGFVVVEKKAAKDRRQEDGRKGFLSVTPKAIGAIEKDLLNIALLLGRPLLMSAFAAEAGMRGIGSFDKVEMALVEEAQRNLPGFMSVEVSGKGLEEWLATGHLGVMEGFEFGPAPRSREGEKFNTIMAIRMYLAEQERTTGRTKLHEAWDTLWARGQLLVELGLAGAATSSGIANEPESASNLSAPFVSEHASEYLRNSLEEIASILIAEEDYTVHKDTKTIVLTHSGMDKALAEARRRFGPEDVDAHKSVFAKHIKARLIAKEGLGPPLREGPMPVVPTYVEREKRAKQGWGRATHKDSLVHPDDLGARGIGAQKIEKADAPVSSGARKSTKPSGKGRRPASS